MLGVLKNFPILRKILDLSKTNNIYDVFNWRDDKIAIEDLQIFTVFIKTIVSFSDFKIKMFVSFPVFLFTMNAPF